MKQKLLWRLLRCHLSIAQTVGFALAGVVGMTIVLLAVQVYRDVLPIFNQPDAFAQGDYLVLSRQVSTLQTLGLGNNGFSEEALQELRKQDFVGDVGAFTPADYRVEGSMDFGGMSMSTYLFFEAVPDRFLDVQPEDWHFEAGDREIPIIIPRNYLNLYNYGFARAQGLPQISEGLFRKVSFSLTLQGNGQRGVFEGRIVGLSNRLNTILVPESFVQWSNAKYGEHGGAVQPSRVIVATTRAVDEPMRNFFTQKGYQIEGDHADGGKALQILQLAASGMAVVGLAFSAMAFYVLLLSIFLLLQRNSRKMENLLLLGYSPRQVARPYELLTLGLNVCVLVIALVLVWLVRSWYLPELAAAQEHYLAASTGFTLLCGIGLALLLTVLNSIAIRRKVNGLTLRHKSKIVPRTS